MSFVMDFSDPDSGKPPVPFTIDGETFYVAPAAPAGALQDMARIGELAKQERMAEMLTMFNGFLSMVLMPESLERFTARMRDPQKPITQAQLTKIVKWLMEHYAGRPTEPASSSQTGQGTTGTSSTDGASPEASTSSVWDSVVPST